MPFPLPISLRCNYLLFVIVVSEHWYEFPKISNYNIITQQGDINHHIVVASQYLLGRKSVNIWWNETYGWNFSGRTELEFGVIFLFFWTTFLATYRFAMLKIATFSENIWAPDGVHTSVWTISTFHIALFSEKLCPVAFLTKLFYIKGWYGPNRGM